MTNVRVRWPLLAGLVVLVAVGVECVRYINLARAGLIGHSFGQMESPAWSYTAGLLGCCFVAAGCLAGFLMTFRR